MNRAEDNSRSVSGMTLNNRRIAPRKKCDIAAPCTRIIRYNGFTINLLEGTAMLKISELAMPRTRKVTTVCNGRREVWTDYEEAEAYFLYLMMSTESEEHERVECVYIQLLHGLDECSDGDE